MSDFATAAVIGAGVMGAGVAAQLADAGLSVVLLDRDEAVARAGIARQLKFGGFRDPSRAEAIRTGTVEADMAALGDADWIIEAAAEQIAVKRAILRAVGAVRKPRAIVSSTTSTIPLSHLVERLDAAYARHVLVTHFFNPPIRMRLLELVSNLATDQESVAKVDRFAAASLNKVVVRCADTPGFVANRIGNFWLSSGLEAAQRFGLEVETADAVLRSPFGAPVGVFAFLDLVGIDLAPTALASLQSELPKDDALQAFASEPPLLAEMIRLGRFGRKAEAGFVRRSASGDLEVLDLSTYDYRQARPPAVPALEPTREDLRATLADTGPVGRFAWAVMSRTLAYAAALVPSVVHSPELVDVAMREGYGWAQGPFALIEAIGPSWLVQRLRRDRTPVAPVLAAMAEPPT